MREVAVDVRNVDGRREDKRLLCQPYNVVRANSLEGVRAVPHDGHEALSNTAAVTRRGE